MNKLLKSLWSGWTKKLPNTFNLKLFVNSFKEKHDRPWPTVLKLTQGKYGDTGCQNLQKKIPKKSRFKTSRLQTKVETPTLTSLRLNEKINSQAGSTGDPVALETTQK